METPLTPLEFARRARRLFGAREAVVDGDVRFTYEQFFDRCDRWSAVLQRLGVTPGDRVAYIAPNIHAQLESFYAVPQIGAVLVPINYRLAADDFAYIIAHCGAKVVCVAAECLAAVDGLRAQLPSVEHFVALEDARDGWIAYEHELAAVAPAGVPPTFERAAIDEDGLLTINYTSGTTARPKGVMITHRNAWFNTIGVLVHVPMGPADRYLWTLPMFHANGWTFTWTVTAAGGTHVCLRQPAPARVFELIEREAITAFCAAPTVLIGLANAPDEVRRGAAPADSGHHRRRGARGGDHRPDRKRTRLDGDAGLRADRNVAADHDLSAAAGARVARRPTSGRPSRLDRASSSSPRARCAWSATTAARFRPTARRSARLSRAATW